jgi:hypothetical protein
VQLDLSDDQVALLRELLDSALRDLRFEIADTDNVEFKHGLKAREDQIRALLAPLGGPLPDQS